MNKHIDALVLRAVAVEVEDYLRDLGAEPVQLLDPAPRHSKPFSKRADGRQRRNERRFVRAAKSAWLNS